jgi:predicted dehydrogenase
VLIELGVHLIDVAVWFLGREITGVESTLTAARDPELESDAHVVLRFAAGAVAEVSVSDRVALPRSLAIEGSDGWLSVGLDEDQPVELFSRSAPVCRIDGAQRVRTRPVDPFDLQLQEFVDCIGSGASFPVSGADVLAGLEIIARVYAERREAA